MYNTPRPDPKDLPSPRQLRRSSIAAAVSAAFLFVCVVLPAEYGVDPTRVGSILGLTEMGEIKQQLAEEAKEDHQSDASRETREGLVDIAFGFFVSTAHAEEAEEWLDEVTFTLAPGESAEWKLVMTEGQTAEYRMLVEGGRINFDLHGHGAGRSTTYEKGRGSTGSEGSILAAFDGEHGWFWRNRDDADVTVTISVRGDYAEFKDAG